MNLFYPYPLMLPIVGGIRMPIAYAQIGPGSLCKGNSGRPRKRRRADELSPEERWLCVNDGCGKIYRKTSIASIEQHQRLCVFSAALADTASSLLGKRIPGLDPTAQVGAEPNGRIGDATSPFVPQPSMAGDAAQVDQVDHEVKASLGARGPKHDVAESVTMAASGVPPWMSGSAGALAEAVPSLSVPLEASAARGTGHQDVKCSMVPGSDHGDSAVSQRLDSRGQFQGGEPINSRSMARGLAGQAVGQQQISVAHAAQHLGICDARVGWRGPPQGSWSGPAALVAVASGAPLRSVRHPLSLASGGESLQAMDVDAAGPEESSGPLKSSGRQDLAAGGFVLTPASFLGPGWSIVCSAAWFGFIVCRFRPR